MIVKNLSKEKLILFKKLIGLGSAVLCLVLMFIRFIKYTSTSTTLSGSSITFDENLSLYEFLFNKDYIVFDGNVGILRDAFGYSHVIMWLVFILCLISVVTLTVGVFMKKSLFSKIGNCILLGAFIVLITMIFDKESSANTVRYLNVFTWGYGLLVIASGLGFMSTITLKD